MWHRDNRLQSEDDFTSFQFMGPMDDRLGQWSNYAYTLYNLDPDLFGQVSKYVTTSSMNDRVYDGFEFVLDGRMSNGAFFGGSFTTERTQLNECDVDEIANPIWLSYRQWCDAPRAWQTMYKAHGAYPLPGGVIISTFVQGYPGPNLDANLNITEMPDGTALTGGQRITLDLLPHEVLFHAVSAQGGPPADAAVQHRQHDHRAGDGHVQPVQREHRDQRQPDVRGTSG